MSDRMSAAGASALSPNPLALRMAHAGLVPFILGTLLIWLIGDRNPEAYGFAAQGLSTYAGLVVAFLGGIYWGLAFRQAVPSPLPFGWGLAPVLFGWVGTVMPPHAGLALHGMVLIVCYLVDRRLYPQLGAGAWLTLRFRLSAVAALCCFLAAAGS